MEIYIDLLILLNIDLDFILLMSVSIILKRNTKLQRIFFGSLFGALTTFILFIKMSSIIAFLFKLILGLLMSIITFGYKNLKYTLNNFYYLIVNSIIIGGGLYLVKDYGFYNYYVLIIGFVVIMGIYISQIKKYKSNYTNYFKVSVYVKDKLYNLSGYLDTGNKLYDQYCHRPVILTSKKIKYDIEELIYVPCNTLNNTSLVKCIKTDKVIINKKVYKNFLLGFSNNKFMIDDVDCILHSSLKGELI